MCLSVWPMWRALLVGFHCSRMRDHSLAGLVVPCSKLCTCLPLVHAGRPLRSAAQAPKHWGCLVAAGSPSIASDAEQACTCAQATPLVSAAPSAKHWGPLWQLRWQARPSLAEGLVSTAADGRLTQWSLSRVRFCRLSAGLLAAARCNVLGACTWPALMPRSPAERLVSTAADGRL